MQYITLEPLNVETSKGTVKLLRGQRVRFADNVALQLIEENKIMPVIQMWLDKLSDSERDIFKERAAIMEVEAGLDRERAEVEAIKRIISERVISGKCDKCNRVNSCLLTKKQRQLCEVASLL